MVRLRHQPPSCRMRGVWRLSPIPSLHATMGCQARGIRLLPVMQRSCEVPRLLRRWHVCTGLVLHVYLTTMCAPGRRTHRVWPTVCLPCLCARWQPRLLMLGMHWHTVSRACVALRCSSVGMGVRHHVARASCTAIDRVLHHGRPRITQLLQLPWSGTLVRMCGACPTVPIGRSCVHARWVQWPLRCALCGTGTVSHVGVPSSGRCAGGLRKVLRVLCTRPCYHMHRLRKSLLPPAYSAGVGDGSHCI